MHEASIILSVIETVSKQCQQEGYGKINSIRLRIGKASSVVPDSLQFAFEVIKLNTLAKNAYLEIETIPITANCSDCGHEFEIQSNFTYTYSCPGCKSTAFTIIKGYEMEIVDMEVD